jgi:hypothetical protein
VFESAKPKSRLFPAVDTVDEARDASRYGMWAAVFCAVVTSILALLAMSGVEVGEGIDGWSLLDALLFFGVALGIRSMSRVAAVFGLLLYVGERAFMWASSGRANGAIMAVFLTIAFGNSVRGTFAFHRLRRDENSLLPTSQPMPPAVP